MLRSAFCTYEQLHSEEFQTWIRALGRSQERPHRKDWELGFIAAKFFARKPVRSSTKLLGFGVGVEPLPALFAAHGYSVLATDRPDEVPEWRGQHSTRVESLERYDLLDDAAKSRITFQSVDMKAIPESLHGQFDFVWSTSSMEHLGSLSEAERFVGESLKCLKPGGVAVHITEASVYPLDSMPDDRGTVFFTVPRLYALLDRYGAYGGDDLDTRGFGSHPADYYVDVAPYTGAAHLKLLVDGFVTTSVALVFHK